MDLKKHVTILGVPFVYITKKQFLETVVYRSVEKQEKQMIVTANPEIVMYAQEDSNYKEIVSKADYVVADGIGIIIASKIIKKTLPERIPGFELVEEMLAYADKQKKSIYLFGAKESVLYKTVDNIKNSYPNLTIAGFHHGYIDSFDPTVINEVEETQPDFILVALGFPKQEEWIYENKSKLNKGIWVGVGGSFDVLAGEVKRAPKLWQKLYLEWFYRLLADPTRFKRVIKLPLFLIHVLRGKFSRKG
ncbi:N-acetylglucosaminyldiphosphoundecaprenol N-acetyl-beta-D-mannosaminyltransferase [Alkalibacillus filiformis]|uniref:N-acetylglucosaminyldiphosphoundecaprenol N-acetyl-beta-D-mannosaminyltransferase n=1 Tax=Alkalibacillus filiformis TaxID=200990 RepID=A0ABU0DWD8_9BACI|nr:WecB/TagA/CpsF family glycosyltransferase [Alkalibacillus filiformis]MDQ0352776.1 N-acetylglucosaminyldiphosphoundecaprenol N-acetyl-beta-D-mannosaminyltransferase [Alkalibacillus filiformis]